MPEKKKPETEEKIGNLFIDKTEGEYLNWIDDQVSNHPVVKTQHGTWKELIDWEEGNQFSLWDEKKRAVTPVKLTIRKKKVVINLLKPLLETIDGKLNFMHRIVGVPNSGEEIDIRGAQVATKLLDSNDEYNGHEELLEDLKYDLLRPGMACKKWYWDRDAKTYVKKGKGSEYGSYGEVIGEVVPIFNLRIDPSAKTIEKARWVIELKDVAIDELKKTYKLSDAFLNEIKQGEADKSKKFEGMNEPIQERGEDEETLVVREHWERPSSNYKKGRFIVSIRGKVIYRDYNKSPDHDLPYFPYWYKKSSYSQFGKGPLHYTQEIQREFNRAVSIQSEHHEAWRPKLAVSRGGLKRAGALTIDNFEIVEVNVPGVDVRPIQMPELSPQLTEFRNFLIQARDMVSNIHEVSYSRLPQYASRAPASLYSMMLEQENVKLSPMVKRINRTLVKEARFRLKLMAQHYDLPRMVKVVGENRRRSVEYFEKADLNDNFDVRLEVGVSLNQSPTIQTRLFIELWQNGLLTPKDRIRVLRTLNLGTAERELRSDIVDSERADRENQAFQDGTWKNNREKGGVFLYVHDDHETHLDIHTDFMKTEEGARLPNDDFVALHRHIQHHWKLFQAIQAAMVQKMAAGLQNQPGLPMPGMGQPQEAPGMGLGIEGFMPTS